MKKNEILLLTAWSTIVVLVITGTAALVSVTFTESDVTYNTDISSNYTPADLTNLVDRDKLTTSAGSSGIPYAIEQSLNIPDVLSATVIDLDNSGSLDLVFAVDVSDNIVFRIFQENSGQFENTFNHTPSWSTDESSNSYMETGDTDNDGIEEIIFTNQFTRSYEYNATSSMFQQQFVHASFGNVDYMILGDLNDNGLQEIILSGNNGTNGLGEVKGFAEGWEYNGTSSDYSKIYEFCEAEDEYGHISEVTISDMDGDGYSEFNYISHNNRLRVIERYNGGYLQIFSAVLDKNLGCITSGDTNGDGRDELFIGVTDSDGFLVYDMSGKIFDGRSIGSFGDGHRKHARLVDISHDGLPEVLFDSSSGIFSIGATWNNSWTVYSEYIHNMGELKDFRAGNLDSDQRLEIVVFDKNRPSGESSSGTVFLLEEQVTDLSTELSDTDVLILLQTEFDFPGDPALMSIIDWWTSDVNKTIWFLGDSDYAGIFDSFSMNYLLSKLDSDLRIQSDSVEDYESNDDGGAYRVIGSVVNRMPGVPDSLTSDVDTILSHGPAASVSLSNFTSPNSAWLINTTTNSSIVDWDGIPSKYWEYPRGNYDSYPLVTAEWDLPLFNGSSHFGKVLCSGETLISDYKNIFNYQTDFGNPIDTIQLVSNLLDWSTDNMDGDILVLETMSDYLHFRSTEFFRAKAAEWGYEVESKGKTDLALDGKYSEWNQLMDGYVHDIATGDIDDDGIDELALVTDGQIKVFRITPGNVQTIDTITAGNVECVAFGDINRDGISDLLTLVYRPGWITYYEGNGDGTFSNQLTLSWDVPLDQMITEFDAVDLNNDGYLDFMILSDVEGTWIYYGTPDMNSYTGEQIVNEFILHNHGGTFVDLNHDDFMDLAIISRHGNATHVYGQLTTYINEQGSGFIRQPETYVFPMKNTGPSLTIKAGDLNGDSCPDFVIGYSTDINPSDTYILYRDRLSSNSISYRIAEPNSAWLGLGVIDMNGDGSLEIIQGYGNGLYVTLPFQDFPDIDGTSTGNDDTPSAPRGLASSTSGGEITVSWHIPLSDGGRSILNYRIYRGTSMNNLFQHASISRFTLEYTDDDVSLGVDYYYAVSAENEIGESPLSDIIGPLQASESEPTISTSSSYSFSFSSDGPNITVLLLSMASIVIIRLARSGKKTKKG